MEPYLCALPIVGGIAITLFPSQARDVYTALSMYAWLRDFAAQRSNLAYRIFGVIMIAAGIWLRSLK